VPALLSEIAAKAVLYAAVLVATGACAIPSLLLPLLGGWPSREIETVARAVIPVRTRAAVAVLIALGLRALMHTAAIFEWPAVLTWDAVQTVAIESHWGSAWQFQVAAAVIFLAASVWAGRGRPTPTARDRVATVACIALCYSMPLLGHGASSRWYMLLHGTHLLAAGIWVGTLLALVLIRVSPKHRLTMLRGLSPLALAGATVLALAGLVMAWSYLGPISNLWTTTYGRLLALKLAFFLGIAAFGFVNWRRFGAERRGADESERLGPVMIEVVLVAIVVLVTAALTEVAHP
jgi:putative copper resistance protein D